MAAALAAGMQSCEIETSHNGDLDGFWHLTGVDTLATGGKRDLAHAKSVSYTHLTLPTN